MKRILVCESEFKVVSSKVSIAVCFARALDLLTVNVMKKMLADRDDELSSVRALLFGENHVKIVRYEQAFIFPS